MRYRLMFYGRKVGAIGIWSTYEVVIEAPSKEKAESLLYLSHEHISGLRIDEVIESPPLYSTDED